MSDTSKPPVTPSDTGPLPFSYQQQRNKFLITILRGSSIIGLFVVISYVGNTTPALAAVIIGAYIALLVATFVPFPYPVRAVVLLTITYALGISALFEAGIYGDSRLFFLAFALLAAMLFDRQKYFIAIGLSVTATTLVGWFLMSGRLGLTTNEVTIGSLSTWVVETLVLILITTAFEEGWRQLRQEFNVSQATLLNAISALGNERAHLEERVTERTTELNTSVELAQKRADRLHAISELAHTIAFIQDPAELLPTITRLISEHFGFYHVGIFLTDKNSENIILQAANSEGGLRMLSRGYKLKMGQANIVSSVVATGVPLITTNGNDLSHFKNSDLPETHSEIALPLGIGQRIIGALDIQSTEVSAFSEQDIEVMQTLANQVSIAIENASLLSETRSALAEARAVYGHQIRQAWEQLPKSIRATGYQYAGAKVSAIENPLDLPEVKSAVKTGQLIVPPSKNSAIAIPLKLRGEVIGVLDIRSNTPERRWTENEMALVQAVAERVALALENARLYEESTRRADRERTVSDITTKIRAITIPQYMLDIAMDELKRVLGAQDVQIRPYNPDEKEQIQVGKAPKKNSRLVKK